MELQAPVIYIAVPCPLLVGARLLVLFCNFRHSFPSSLYRIMQFVVLISLLFTLSAAALISDSGILTDGHVETAPNVDGEGPGIPTRRSINVVRMSRGMSSLPPTRRRRGHCAYPLPTILSSTFTHMTFLFCSEAPCFACCLCCLLL